MGRRSLPESALLRPVLLAGGTNGGVVLPSGPEASAGVIDRGGRRRDRPSEPEAATRVPFGQKVGRGTVAMSIPMERGPVPEAALPGGILGCGLQA